MRTRFKSNAKALTRALLNRGMSLVEAAKFVGITHETLSAAMRSDINLALKTASLLKQAFGAETIRCEHVTDDEVVGLKFGIESQPERRQKVFGALHGVISQLKEMRSSLDEKADANIIAALDETLISAYKLAAHVATDSPLYIGEKIS